MCALYRKINNYIIAIHQNSDYLIDFCFQIVKLCYTVSKTEVYFYLFQLYQYKWREINIISNFESVVAFFKNLVDISYGVPAIFTVYV